MYGVYLTIQNHSFKTIRVRAGVYKHKAKKVCDAGS